MKYLILIGDGMGDFSLEKLGGKTPLEAARTPAMDYLAAHGRIALAWTIPEGYPPGSDVANLSLLGYLPEECYSGRAPLEAASMGVELARDEIAFRCNLVTLDHKPDGSVVMVDYSAGHIATPEAKELIETIDREQKDQSLKLYPGKSYRHLLVHKGSPEDLQTVPPHDHTGQAVTEYWHRYKNSPRFSALFDCADKVLHAHPVNTKRIEDGKKPANSIWLWGEGRAPVMKTLQERYGISGSLISAVDLLKGIGVYAGMEIIDVPGATGYLDTNYKGKADAAIDALKEKDLVFVHVEAPDEAGHQGLLNEKMQAIEDFDQKIVQPIFDAVNERDDVRIVVAMDHFTPISLKTHTELPVPVVMYDTGTISGDIDRIYSEKSAFASGEIFENGKALFEAIIASRK